MKKKISFPLYSVVALAIVLVFSCFVFVADLLLDRGIYLYTGSSSFTTGDLFIAIFFHGGWLFISAIAVLLCKNLRKRFLRVVIIIVIALIICYFICGVFVSCVLFMPKTYVEAISDNGEHCIIIGEDCYFFSPYGGDIFEKTSFCTMEKIGRYYVDIDFYTPFYDGNYYVIWNENDFELHYDVDGEGEEYTVITVEYLE